MTSSSREQAPNQIYASQPILQVKIKSWHTVAEWKWDVNDDCCGICRMPFDAHCVDCKLPGDDCPPVWGRCAHAFHMHCIVKWLTTKGNNQQCPMCRQEWQFRN
jgi:anaphase-promoting complex subunit 11